MSKSTGKGKGKGTPEGETLSPLAAEMVAGLSEFCDALEAGVPIETRFTVRTVTLDLKPSAYGPDDVRRVRKALGASQPLLARFLGVSVKTVRSWEQGTRPVPTIACRYLDDVVAYPELWERRVRLRLPAAGGPDAAD